MSLDVSSIAAKVANRVLAERREAGGSPAPPRPPRTPRVADPAPPAQRPSPAAGGLPLVTANCLRNTPEGGRYTVPPGARITPLAREEAWRRRIELVGDGEGGGAR